jgi:hypothetical protein
MRILNLLILFGIGLGLTLWGGLPVLAVPNSSVGQMYKQKSKLSETECDCWGCPAGCQASYASCTTNPSASACPNPPVYPDVPSCCCAMVTSGC